MLNILVVDDSDLDRERIRRMLERSSNEEFRISEADGGQAGLALMKEQTFDCVLLDYRLQDMTGIQYLQTAQQEGITDLAVIMLTGFASEEIDLKATELGAHDYLVKDEIQPAILERSIRYSVCHQSQLKALQNAIQVKDDFLAAMSHEMRTPLNAVINFSDHLMQGIYGPVSEDVISILGRIYQAGRHLNYLVESVLTTMTIQHDSLLLDLTEVNLADEIEFVLEVLDSTVRQKRLRISSDVSGRCRFQADRNRTRQILFNIIGNAIKFTAEGEISISGQLGDGEIFLAVRDTGIGIPPEKLEAVLQPFCQVDGSITRAAGGVGLGLSISKDLIELHHGRLHLESQLGKGTLVTLVFPESQPSSQTLDLN